MASSTRIPKAELTGVYGWLVKRMSRKMLGDVAEPVEVAWHHRKVVNFSFAIGRRAQKWDACDENLKSFAHMAAVSLVGCSFCLDLGYFMAHNNGLDEAKAREVPRWRESTVFTPLERDVMEYAEAMTVTPPTVTDEMSARLLEQLGPAALIELTTFIALANLYSRSNTALGIESQGFSAACDLRPLAAHTRAHERRPVCHPPQPAVHRRLRDARLRGRRRGRRAGDLAAVGRHRRGRPQRGARPSCVPRPDRHPAGAEPVAFGVPPAGGLHRGVVAGAAADQPRRRRRRRIRRERVDRDAHRAGNARPGRARGVRAARGLRRAL